MESIVINKMIVDNKEYTLTYDGSVLHDIIHERINSNPNIIFTDIITGENIILNLSLIKEIRFIVTSIDEDLIMKFSDNKQPINISDELNSKVRQFLNRFCAYDSSDQTKVYDEYGYIIYQKINDYLSCKYEYDSYGNRIHTIYSNGYQEWYEFNSKHKILSYANNQKAIQKYRK